MNDYIGKGRVGDMRFLNWLTERCGKPLPYPEFPHAHTTITSAGPPAKVDLEAMEEALGLMPRVQTMHEKPIIDDSLRIVVDSMERFEKIRSVYPHINALVCITGIPVIENPQLEGIWAWGRHPHSGEFVCQRLDVQPEGTKNEG